MTSITLKRLQGHPRHTLPVRQRGVVLFLALVSLLAIMLAAVALVRSVDTATLIAGNLALQQSATRSGDGGAESAIAWLTTTQTNNSTLNVLLDTNHPFNLDNANAGYYSGGTNLALDSATLTGLTWSSTNSVPLSMDASGNTTRYIIQRMCQTANVAVANAGCLFSSATVDNSGQNVALPQDICSGPGCPAAGQAAQMRITTKTTGPKNTLSYVQTFVY